LAHGENALLFTRPNGFETGCGDFWKRDEHDRAGKQMPCHIKLVRGIRSQVFPILRLKVDLARLVDFEPGTANPGSKRGFWWILRLADICSKRVSIWKHFSAHPAAAGYFNLEVMAAFKMLH
jgi:hypothetical protein